MSLTSSLLIGRTALTASQVALQVTGNNFANAATPGYSRQVVSLAPLQDGRNGGYFLGRGVQVQGVNRSIDQALQARLWTGVSEESRAGIDSQVLSQVEATLNELTDNDLSSEFDRFFSSWSELANSPNREGARSLVVQQGATLAGSIRGLRDNLITVQRQIDAGLRARVSEADNLLGQIARLNSDIVVAEAGSGQNNSLRDQRDALIGTLSELLDVSVIEQPSGAFDVLVGSTPVVLGGQSRGIELDERTDGGTLELSVKVRADGTGLGIESGAIASLLTQRDAAVTETIDRLDAVASQLIFQVNRIHSTGYGAGGLTTVTGTRTVQPSDTALALNDPQNTAFASLPFAAVNGSFLVTVTNQATGEKQTVRIEVDLDGIDSTGARGFADDTSAADLAASLNGVANLTAALNSDGTLSINAGSGFTFEFSEDSSGALAVLGINTYFTGDSAADIDVRGVLLTQPGLLSTGRTVAGNPTDNGAALAILALRDEANATLGGQSISTAWLSAAQTVGADAAAAAGRADSATLVRQSLESQRSAISGVNVDEESVNLLSYQRQYEGAARFISVVDELTQTLLSLVG